MEACLKMEMCFLTSNYFHKYLMAFWKFSTVSGTATWEHGKQNLAACSSYELKVIHSLKWTSMRSLWRVIRHQEDFTPRIVYWIMRQQVMLFRTFKSRSAGEFLTLKGISFKKLGFIQRWCIIPSSITWIKNVKFISNWNRNNISTYASNSMLSSSHNASRCNTLKKLKFLVFLITVFNWSY